MKTRYLKNIPCIALTAAVVSLSGCGTGQAADGTSESEKISVGAPQNLRTSSDMNISPANVNTSDPAIKRQDTLTSPKAPSAP